MQKKLIMSIFVVLLLITRICIVRADDISDFNHYLIIDEEEKSIVLTLKASSITNLSGNIVFDSNNLTYVGIDAGNLFTVTNKGDNSFTVDKTAEGEFGEEPEVLACIKFSIDDKLNLSEISELGTKIVIQNITYTNLDGQSGNLDDIEYDVTINHNDEEVKEVDDDSYLELEPIEDQDIQESNLHSEEKELQLEKDEINTLEQTKNEEETKFIDNSQIALANGKIIDNKLQNKIYIIISCCILSIVILIISYMIHKKMKNRNYNKTKWYTFDKLVKGAVLLLFNMQNNIDIFRLFY